MSNSSCNGQNIALFKDVCERIAKMWTFHTFITGISSSIYSWCETVLRLGTSSAVFIPLLTDYKEEMDVTFMLVIGLAIFIKLKI